MDALLVVDLQNDFFPGGPLGVPEGDLVVPVANRLAEAFSLVVATQDWHPLDHASFAANHEGKQPGDVIELDGLEQFLWPVHCVQETPGAEFHPTLNLGPVDHVVKKGTNPRVDSYSGFFDNGHRVSTGLADYLREHNVARVTICGLAADVCVKFTALDAVKLGFETHVVEDACRGVDLRPGDVDRAFHEMKQAGVQIVESSGILGRG